MSEPGNGPRRQQHGAARRRHRATQLLNALESLCRGDRGGRVALVTIIPLGDVRSLHSVRVILDCALRAARRRARRDTNHVTTALPRP